MSEVVERDALRYTSVYVEKRGDAHVVVMRDLTGKWWNCGHKHRDELRAGACERRQRKVRA